MDIQAQVTPPDTTKELAAYFDTLLDIDNQLEAMRRLVVCIVQAIVQQEVRYMLDLAGKIVGFDRQDVILQACHRSRYRY